MIDLSIYPFHSKSLLLYIVLCVLAIKQNLIYVSKFCSSNHVYVEFLPQHFMVNDLCIGAILMQRPNSQGVYEWSSRTSISTYTTLIVSLHLWPTGTQVLVIHQINLYIVFCLPLIYQCLVLNNLLNLETFVSSINHTNYHFILFFYKTVPFFNYLTLMLRDIPLHLSWVQSIFWSSKK